MTNLPGSAQFFQPFEEPPGQDWRTRTGDGETLSNITFRDGYARFSVDATNDKRNVWWAIMETTVSEDLDLRQLNREGYELRIEVRIRSSHAPRRINLHLNTQRTTDFHTHLTEFDIPDTEDWHILSMTTEDFDGRPDDTINGHIAMMDWGTREYHIDVDYFRVDVVDISETDPDSGEQVQYPPPEPEPGEFRISEPATEAAMIDRQYPEVNLSGWQQNQEPLLTTDGTKTILLSWNLEAYRDRTVADYGMLELTPHAYLQAYGTGVHEFDHVRLVEILDGKPDWTREEVSFDRFTEGRALDEVLNTQMIIDIDMSEQTLEGPVHVHIPRPVIQRMLDGRTKGIAIYPLGALHASFKSGKIDADHRPRLYFDTK